ncbi:hypothetical protein [Clostridium saccharobutylicum]|uniref:Surface protein PspC n=1 Tax=Clostridium saccharobutylicum DSM 13864 TaxID=1345695 RepID=U5MPQ9_CLOSA|nr:hypothetical protein [Clostridium saccharobutylicum]AGX42565.1 surface protein PspC [Clostridium saccharobutylicum DSM 13864]AQR89851.1 hypothetical protein CLOSC_15560 [Clostridium saccharobutylicum]AQR99755.1 hypothetical protein CSACC_15640 [Clostridium saccharobutylicum]AQS09483.1 hypothetical protein CLOBY_16120 [Clostridium saccharobutylicum]AQS13739.1 hypothetical protein CLOSACC_15640 [Clostridium saccharobutylicum]
MIRKYLNKIITLGIVVISISALNPIRVHADTKIYTEIDANRKKFVNNNRIEFLKEDGTYARNEWIHEKGSNIVWGHYDIWNYFGDDCIDKEGWFQVDGKWYYGDEDHSSDYYAIRTNEFNGDYYLGADGAMVTNTWFKTYALRGLGLAWYYSGADGKILRNTYTPDGYWVNSDGIWE